MIQYEKLRQMAEAAGFSASVPLRMQTIELRPEVREMCAENICGRYDKCWSCPPGCGTLEECKKRIERYTGGILVQTVGETEDAFDFETMVEIEREHKDHFQKMYAALRAEGKDVLALGAGCCTCCDPCAYPDAPCRFPEKMVSSMEAYGILVLQICRDNHLQYYYGPNKIAYTSCFLL